MMATCGEEPEAGLAAKWVSISNCYMKIGASGRPGRQVGVSIAYMWGGFWGGPCCQVGIAHVSRDPRNLKSAVDILWRLHLCRVRPTPARNT